MFQSDRARQRLQMCEDCRVIDAVQDAKPCSQACCSAAAPPKSKTDNHDESTAICADHAALTTDQSASGLDA